MAVTVDEIRARAEFRTTEPALVAQAIADAEQLVNRDAYPSAERADVAVRFMAMHIVALSPFGEHLRQGEAKGESVYGRLFEQVETRNANVRGPVVIA